MTPFGTCLRLWRSHLQISQQTLARLAGVPRPNLSDFERGRREPTLGTLRAIAFALKIRPGILADGIPPGEAAEPLSREALERAADSAAGLRAPADPAEGGLAADLALLADSRSRRSPVSDRRLDSAWLRLAARRPRAELASLLERSAERKRRP